MRSGGGTGSRERAGFGNQREAMSEKTKSE